MTLPSRKNRPTTPPNTTGATTPEPRTAAAAYRAVDRATRPQRTSEPLWLPAGWLAVVVVLSSTFPAWGASGWRARSDSKTITSRSSSTDFSTPRRDHHLRPVDYRADLAGPALRIAQRNDPLLEAIERPYGVSEEPTENLNEVESITSPNDGAENLFNDLPPDPFDEPMETQPEPDAYEQVETTQESYPEYEQTPTYAEPATSDDSDYLANERVEAAEDCAEELAELKAQRLNTIDLEIGIQGVEGQDYPFVCSIDDGSLFAPRQWAEVTFMWKASALCHKPLYFEDVHLERYGHSWGPIAQPIVSGAHFFTRFPVLPYCMGLKAPNECVYTLGHYRPGNCAPYMIDPIPFTWRAALFEAGGAFGVIGFLP